MAKTISVALLLTQAVLLLESAPLFGDGTENAMKVWRQDLPIVASKNTFDKHQENGFRLISAVRNKRREPELVGNEPEAFPATSKRSRRNEPEFLPEVKYRRSIREPELAPEMKKREPELTALETRIRLKRSEPEIFEHSEPEMTPELKSQPRSKRSEPELVPEISGDPRNGRQPEINNKIRFKRSQPELKQS